ncbi:MerR family transcriptional regulator [Salicibibacter cibi]|uniref:MerR family transcriptional regulator n=1 Tax=Salicibibacter cibi TaxID=2743001 RepID=UPI0031B5E69B
MIPIQEMTNQTGITVRTLRYYDHIGLLKPYTKTSGGHRVYSKEELKKLQQIQFFKTIGFKLQEIQDILENPEWDWVTGLKNQMAHVRNEQKKLKKMESSIRGMMHVIAMEGEVSPAKIEQLIKLTGNKKQSFREERFDENEMNLLDRLPNVNKDDPDSLEWVALLGQLKRHMPKGARASSVQRIIRRMGGKNGRSIWRCA